jgi:hypothetical protein
MPTVREHWRLVDFSAMAAAVIAAPGWSLRTEELVWADTLNVVLTHTDGRRIAKVVTAVDLRDDPHACQRALWQWVLDVTTPVAPAPVVRPTRHIELE